MKKLSLIFVLTFLFLGALQTKAQNANSNGSLNFSKIDVVEYAPNQAYISVKLVGTLAPEVTEVYYTIQGDRIPGGEISMILDQSRYAEIDPEWVVNFSLLPKTGDPNLPDFVDIEIGSNASMAKAKIAKKRVEANKGRPVGGY